MRVYERIEVGCCGESLEVLKGDQRVYAVRGAYRFYISRFFDQSGEHTIPIGQDITGNGVPNLVVTHWTGGAHCCTTFHVFEIGEQFRPIGTVYVGDYEPREVADLDGDGNWEFVVRDWAYVWVGPWPPHQGPTAWVILHYENGGYHLAAELMRTEATTPEEMSAIVQEIRDRHYPDISCSLILRTFVLELVYSGHAELVEPFLELVWPEDVEEREKLLAGLLKALAESLYWPELKELSAEWPWPEGDEGRGD